MSKYHFATDLQNALEVAGSTGKVGRFGDKAILMRDNGQAYMISIEDGFLNIWDCDYRSILTARDNDETIVAQIVDLINQMDSNDSLLGD